MSFLTVLWFILIAVLWIGYLTLEGFDFGVGMLLKILPKNETERRQALGSIGPHWDGNEVWLLTAGGATFAAFPTWYSTMFSGMYLALFVILLCLIVRICALEWRGKIQSHKWVTFWDWAHTISAWLPAILWGVAFANLIAGLNITVNDAVTGKLVAPGDVASYADPIAHNLNGGLLGLISPFTILGGLVTAALFLTQGALYMSVKLGGDIQQRASKAAKILSVISLVIPAIFVIWAQLAYSPSVYTWIPLVLAALCLLATLWAAWSGRNGLAFTFNFLAIALAVVFIFSITFPNALKSAVDPAYSLSLAEAASKSSTLVIMTVAALIFVPIVLAYTVWSYWVFSARISPEKIGPAPGLDPKKIRQFFKQN